MTDRTQNADFRRNSQFFADSPLLREIQAFVPLEGEGKQGVWKGGGGRFFIENKQGGFMRRGEDGGVCADWGDFVFRPKSPTK